jgi:hypothetical protein
LTSSTLTQTEIFQSHHGRAVRFFWALLIGSTTVSLIGNIVHAVLPYIPPAAIEIGAAAVPPIALLAAVHGIGLGACGSLRQGLPLAGPGGARLDERRSVKTRAEAKGAVTVRQILAENRLNFFRPLIVY